MDHSNTRQKIKETALALFSKNGYDAVSIRDICGKVGIRESTVYYYFKNKKSMFDELLADFETVTAKVQNDFNSRFSKTVTVGEDSFLRVGLAFLNNYLLDDRILKLLRMLSIEQQRSADAAALLHRVLFEDPLRKMETVFEAMMAGGVWKKHDAKAMAVEYYAPIFLAFQRYFSSGDVTDENRKMADAMVAAHLSDFFRRYSYT